MMKFPIMLLLFGILLVIPSSSAQDNAASTITIEPSDPIFEVDSEVTLDCYDNDAFTIVRWLRGGNLPLPSNAEDENGFLTIKNVQLEDAGIYICEKIVDSGSTSVPSAEVTLLVEQPSIDSSVSTTTIHGSTKVEVTASPSTLAQRADVTLLAEKPRIDSSSVSITPHASGKVELTIDSPHSPVKLHSKVTFSCYAKDNSPVSVHWQRRNRKVPLSSRAVDEYGKLTISDVQPEDAGFYICETAGGSPSTLVGQAQAMLLVEGPRDDSARRVPQEVNEGELTIYPAYPSVNLHSTITLSCYAKDHSPVSVEWRRRERNIPFPSSAIVKNGNLTIHDAQSEDAGSYVCETTGDSPSKLNERADVTLLVNTPRIDSSSVSTTPHASGKVELTIDSPHSPVKLHSKVTFSCHAKDNSPVSVHWQRRNRKVPLPSRAVDEYGKLTISDVQPEDAGFYICETAGGSPSTLVGRAQATLLVEGFRDDSARRVPQEVNEGELTIYPAYPSVNLHSTITLSCYAKDHSPVSVEWRRRERNIPFPSGAIVKNGNLTIHNAQSEDTGFYVCETTGDSPSKLKERADVTLLVKTPRIDPSSVSRELPQYADNRAELRIAHAYPFGTIHKLHSTITLSCYANDHSPVFVRWRRQGKKPLPSRAVVQNGNLTIRDVQSEDAGFYACGTTDDSPLRLRNLAGITLHVEKHR